MPQRVFSFLVLILMTIPTSLASADVLAAPSRDRLLTDFTAATPNLGWYVVNDNVMGGRSRGGFETDAGELLFEGRTNTNGGGFSSIRTRSFRADLSNHEGIRIRVKADGRTYTWRLTTDARYRGRPVSYWADFETRKGEWVDARIPFSRFKPQFRGMKLKGPKLDPKRIRGMGLMIYDKRDGAFELRLDSVHAYSAKPSSALAKYRSTRRVLVLFAPTLEDERLVQQLFDIGRTQEDFDARDMTLVVVSGNTGWSSAGTRSRSPRSPRFERRSTSTSRRSGCGSSGKTAARNDPQASRCRWNRCTR